MKDSTLYNKFFSTLTPVRANNSSTDQKDKPKAFFKIKLLDGEPFLGLIVKNSVTAAMSPMEAKLYKEFNRLEEGTDIFQINLESGRERMISLWENPHLVNMLLGLPILGPEGELLRLSSTPAFLILKITSSEDKKEAEMSLCLRAEDEEWNDLTFLDDTHVICGDIVFSVQSAGANYSAIKSLITPVSKELLESYLTLLMTYVGNLFPELNGNMARRISNPEQSVPTLYLEKVASDKALYMRTGVSIDSLNVSLPPDVEPTCVVRIDDGQTIIVREVEGCDIDGLTEMLESMICGCAPNRTAKKEIYRNGKFFIVPEATAGPFLLHNLHKVLENFRMVGSDKLKEYKVVAAQPKLNLNLSSGIDFLDGEGDISIGDEKFTIADLLNQYSKNRYVKLSDGNRGIIDEEYIRRLKRLFLQKDREGKIKVTIFNLPEVEEMLQSKITGKFASQTREVLQGFNKLKKAKAPSYKINATLRPYQNEGVKWLQYLYANNLGGCLADDMGLGKTVQLIALLSLIYPGCQLPTLIIMPRSLLFNWEKELKRFCPQISFSTYYGADRDLECSLKSDVVLTTYALARNDILKLKDHKFECVVLDESQNIKNYTSQTTMAVQLLDSNHRFALSGTPMENNLTELYSLFRFLNPTMFGTIEDFNSSYTMPIQKYGDKEASDSLKRKIFPFILRRLKKNVLKDLPPRIDLTRYVEMSDRQAKLYNERRLSYKQQINAAIAKDGVKKSQFLIFQALSELRRIASVPESASDNKVASPKIEELMELLGESVSNGHKSVVFFNFLAGIELVMERLEKMGIEYETMTGSTSANERKRIVERFQSDPRCMVMLLTLKVGGVGLNLTAADTVYLFEPWWNRAAEEQAINRLHRIGQQASVTSFSLITVGTIEEKILQLQEQKSELFNELISEDGASSKTLTEKDIDFILS